MPSQRSGNTGFRCAGVIAIGLLLTACTHSSIKENKGAICPGADISLALAGPAAIDCGIVAPRRKSMAQERAFDCAVDAVGNGKAFRFGTAVVDDGFFYCNAIASNEEGESWEVTYQRVLQEDNVSIKPPPKVVVVRCDNVGVGTSLDGVIFVEGFECEENAE